MIRVAAGIAAVALVLAISGVGGPVGVVKVVFWAALVVAAIPFMPGFTNNLAHGAAGVATGIGAALSTAAAGLIAQWFGFTVGLLALCAVAAAGFMFVTLLLRESKDAVG